MRKNSECVYSSVCTSDSCSSSCIRYLEMNYLLENSNIPKTRWRPDLLIPDDCDYAAFCELADIKDNITEFVNSGENLYLYSCITGNGKTSWSIKLLLKYFDTVWAGNGFKIRGVFVHIPTFLAKLKNFDFADEEFTKLKDLLPYVDLVVWDDVASTHISNYDHSQLITYFDQRILNRRSNVFTGNLNQSGIEKSLGARLASRVWNASRRIELRGADKR